MSSLSSCYLPFTPVTQVRGGILRCLQGWQLNAQQELRLVEGTANSETAAGAAE